tara:strand:- start:41 stop:487 length:447 start_codon:yes stop_codon:yes gene_type:complete
VKITKKQLHKIIVEEYMKEENITEYSEEAEELIRKMLGDDEYDRRRALEMPKDRNDGNTAPMQKASDSVEDKITVLVQGMEPDDVADLFQSVFSRLPGVEMQGDEPEPASLYGDPKADGRSPITLGPVRENLDLSELKEMIRTMIRDV